MHTTPRVHATLLVRASSRRHHRSISGTLYIVRIRYMLYEDRELGVCLCGTCVREQVGRHTEEQQSLISRFLEQADVTSPALPSHCKFRT